MSWQGEAVAQPPGAVGRSDDRPKRFVVDETAIMLRSSDVKLESAAWLDYNAGC